LVNKLIDAVALATGISRDMPIRINETVSVSLNEVEKLYQNIYLNWHKRKKIFQGFQGLVVTGHTHYPLIVYKNKKIHYVNTGFMCPSISKLEKAQLTYGIYNLADRTFDLVKVSENLEGRIEMCENQPTKNKTITYLQESTYLENKVDLYKSQSNQMSFTFGWSVYNESWEYYMTMQLGVLSKAEELGIDVIKHDQQSNTVRMITGCLDLINKGVDALIVSPYNPEGVPVIAESAQKAGIPVVVIDGGTGGANVAAFIVSDSFAGGIFAGEYALILIKKYKIESKNVAIIKAESTAKYALLRGQGFKSVMIDGGYKVVAEAKGNGEEALAYEEMKNILASYKDDLAAVFCENGNMTIGAARAIDEAGQKGKIMLIGFDADTSVIEGIKNGSIQGTIAQQPFKMGQIGVETANDILTGTPVSYDNAAEKLILMEVFLIDEHGEVRDNIV
jgi:ribose transport system substrate-binding protein